MGGNIVNGRGEDVLVGPLHEVNIRDFSVTRSEITRAQFRMCLNASACTESAEVAAQLRDNGENNNYAVTVTWPQAREFANWVGARLLSESEWEYAARSGGQDIDYPWGNDLPTCRHAHFRLL